MATVEFFLSDNRPEDDVAASGGAVDRKCRWISRADADDIAGGAGDEIDLVSTAAGDTNNVTVAGYKLDGTWVSEVVVMAGAVNVQSVNEFLHLRKVEIDADAVGIITVARFNAATPIELFTIPIGERGASALFLLAKAEAAGGAAKEFYEKVFAVNSTVGALTGVKTYMSEDEDDELKFDLEEDAGVTTTDGNEQVADRLTEPAGYAWADHANAGAAHVCGDAEDGNLILDEAQGIWIQLTLAAGRAKELQVAGTQNWVAD